VKRSLWGCALAVALVSAGCDDGGSEADAGGVAEGDGGGADAGGDGAEEIALVRGASTSETIGPGGGTVTSPDGRLVLEVPAAALSEDTTITITELGGVPGIYELTPDGLTFATPARATLTMSAEDEAAVRGSEPGPLDLRPLLASSDGSLEALGALETSRGADDSFVAVGEVPHFSVVFGGWINPPEISVSEYASRTDRRTRNVAEPFVHDVAVEGNTSSAYYLRLPERDERRIEARVIETRIDRLWTYPATFPSEAVNALLRLGPEALEIAPRVIEPLERADGAFVAYVCERENPDRNNGLVVALEYTETLAARFEIRNVGGTVLDPVLVLGSLPADAPRMVTTTGRTNAFRGVDCVAPEMPNVGHLVSPMDPASLFASDAIGVAPRVGCTDRSDGSDCQEPEPNERVRVVMGRAIELRDEAVARFEREVECRLEEVYCGTGNPLTGGVYYILVFWTELELTVAALMMGTYQLAWPLDADGIEDNNLMPSPSFPFDLYSHTDFWPEIVRNGDEEPRLQVRDAREGFMTVPSDARAIVRGREAAVIIPASEVEERPRFRASVFRSAGPDPLEGEFSASAYPGLEDALRELASGVTVVAE